MTYDIENVLTGIRSLEPFPHVALEVLALAEREELVPSDLIEVVQTDPGITAKILKLVNSAYFGFPREILSLEEAGVMLGTTRLIDLVLTSCAGRYFRNYGHSTPESSSTLWERSLTSALAARLLAEAAGDVTPARAYTAGLLADIGLVVLDRFLPHEWEAEVLGRVNGGEGRVEAEVAVLGISHAEVGARLIEYWELPALLADTIRYHHRPASATIEPPLALLVQLAVEVSGALSEGEVVTPEELEAAGVGTEYLEAVEVLRGVDLTSVRKLDTGPAGWV